MVRRLNIDGDGQGDLVGPPEYTRLAVGALRAMEEQKHG